MKKEMIIIFVGLVTLLVAQNPPHILWTQNYEAFFESAGKTLLKTSDGGYAILTGGTLPPFNDQANFIKIDSNGAEEWRFVYGDYQEIYVSDVIITNDGNFLILTNLDVDNNDSLESVLIKIDENGNIIWEQIYGVEDDTKMYDLKQTNDDGFILCGSQNDLTYLLKLDENGNEIWNHPYFYYDNYSYAKSIIQTANNNYLLVGYKQNQYYFHYSYIMKVDSSGYYQWSHDYSSSLMQNMEDIIAVEDDYFIVVGTNENNDLINGWVIKFDESGNILWENIIGDDNSNRFHKIKYCSNGYYLIGDITYENPTVSSDVWIIKLDYDGSVEWETIYDECENDVGNDLLISSDGFAFLFTAVLDGVFNKIWLVKCEPVTNIENLTLSHEIIGMTNYPNPFNPSTTIEFSIKEDSKVDLSIFNVNGQKIKTLTSSEFTKGSHSIIWRGDNESGKLVGSGIYYYKLNVNDKTEIVKKCLLLK